MPRIRFPDISFPDFGFPDFGFPGFLAAAVFTAAVLGAGAGPARAAVLDHATTNYLTHCGGCHGIEGRAPGTFIPQLRDRVGVFLCSPAGRAYIARVPGVSMSLIRDDQELADVMNFVIFRLAGASAPAGAPPFTAREIHALRQKPLPSDNLLTYRAAILRDAQKECPAARTP